jgi:hypothetical protein
MFVWDWLDWVKLVGLVFVVGTYAWYLRQEHPSLPRKQRLRECMAVGAFGAVYLAVLG